MPVFFDRANSVKELLNSLNMVVCSNANASDSKAVDLLRSSNFLFLVLYFTLSFFSFD